MKKLTEEEFQQKLIDKHGCKFTTLSPYISHKSIIKVKCNVCGSITYQTTNNLLNKDCKNCHTKKQTKTHEQFIIDITNYYGDRITIKNKYETAVTKLNVLCNKCGHEWSVRAGHLSGKNRVECPNCVAKRLGKIKRKTHNDFVTEIQNKYKDKYTILGEYVKSTEKIEIKCNICSCVWKTKPNNLLNGCGCPMCRKSKGEEKVNNKLIKMNIKFIEQKIFDNCKNILPLPFDFYLPEHNLCIEYDGLQHFKPIEFWGGEKSFKIRKENDSIKNDFCIKNNIKLLRIPYTKLSKIDEIIEKTIKN